MKPLTIHQVRQAVAGKALTPIPAEVPLLEAVCTDTRKMVKSSLYIALRGDNVDGHKFIPAAAAGGAIAALVEHLPEQVLPNVHLIGVPDTYAAMGKLATYVRKQMRCKVIAVAGSNGKTGTKGLIDTLLCSRLRGSISPKSFNNHVGVPLTIFPADPFQDYLVLEMGTNHHGELKALSQIALPDIAVITNISAEHLEGLDDLAGVRREEASIITGLNPRGTLIANGDDPDLLAAISTYPGKIITFGLHEANDLFATDIHCDSSGISFLLNANTKERIHIPLLGRHNAINALAAIAVARRMGLPHDEIVQALTHAQPAQMRLQLTRLRDITILNDAYNANPASMLSALQTLQDLSATSRIAVLGDMLELGASSERLHREIGQRLATCPPDRLICIGQQVKYLIDEAQRGGFDPSKIHHYLDSAAACAHLHEFARAGDTILLKGSRGIHLERIDEALHDWQQQVHQARTAHKIAS